MLAALLAVIPGFLFAAEVVSTDASGVTIEYSPEFNAPWIDSNGNLQLSLRDGAIEQEPGKPEQPLRFITVAVPPGSKPTFRVNTWETGETVQGTFASHKIDETSDDKPALYRAPQSTEFLNVFSMLGLATVRIPLYPTRIVGGSPEVITAKKIVGRLDFHSPTKAISTIPIRINRLHKLLIANPEQAASWGRYKTSSFTMAGWPVGFLYRFDIEEEGIYKFTFEDLVGNGVTIDHSGIPSQQLKLFGNGGNELPLAPDADAPVGLKESAIYVEDGGDNLFGPGDWFIFYGRGAGGFIVDPAAGIRFSLNRYVVKNTYWLNIDPSGGGKRMDPIPDDVVASDTLTSVNCRTHFEPDKFIYGGTSFIGGGRDWYGFTFDGPSRISYNVNLPSVDPDDSAQLRLRIVKATGGFDPNIKLKINGVPIDSTIRPLYYFTDSAFVITIPIGVLHAGFNTVYLEQTRTGAADALFDWFEISYSARLNSTLIFNGNRSFRQGVSYKSSLADPWLFDVSNPSDVKVEQGASALIGIAPSYRRFISTQSVDFLRRVPLFQSYFPPNEDIADLYSSGNRADILLIVPDNYYEAVESLYNHYARRDPPLIAARIRLSEVYNRFSGGLRDPAAIRNLLHYAKDNWSTIPQFVLFCGDGDYNYRDLDRPADPDLFPPYEAGYEKSALCSDDWFADFTPPPERDLLPEMAIGRLTARKAWELEAIVKKIVSYDEEPEFGLWRNRITLAADDETSETSNYEFEHVEFSEQLARTIIPGYIDIVKVYETEYARLLGREKPLAAEALLSSINDGTLIVNYMGHGNPTLWAHERLFVLSRDFNRIKASKRLPLYIAFTCDWAYWDDPSAQSFPEQLLAVPDGGAIAAIASTRLTYSPPNQTLSANFYTNQFGDNDLTIGEALWLSKRQAWSSTSPTYHLLGDPSLRLAIPNKRGKFTSITPFPLPPLAKASINGNVLLDSGSVDQQFNGEVLFSLRDSSIPRQYTIGIDEAAITLYYTLPGATAYRGFLNLTNGNFDGYFIVPRDITLNGSNGRATAYFYNEDTDGIAYVDTVRFAGRAVSGTDTIPPEIRLYFDHRGYREGDQVSPEPLVILDLSDSSGVNLTGAMGHGIWLTVGDAKPLNITKSFRYLLDSYQKGSLEQKIGPLEPGKYPIKIEAWDSYNNLAVFKSEIDVVEAAGGLVIDRVLNWPNPFHEVSTLTFSINKPADYEIKIFTVGGRLIRNYQGHTNHNGIVSDVNWDGRDFTGARVGNGVYLYKVNAWDEEGGKADGLGRIAFIR